MSSTPRFFDLVIRSLLLCVAALLLSAVFIPAPLDLPADPSHAPNPAKSAWFLLWIQELVSYSTSAIYGALLLVAMFVSLPWLPVPELERAVWFPREQRKVQILVLATCGLVVALTVVGLFMRGPNWGFVSPF